MNAEDPNDPKFDLVRRALALKRHESPPPRYFNELPGKILSRLAEPEKPEPVPFLEQIRRAFVLRPMLATGAGMLAGVMVLGIAALSMFPTGQQAQGPAATLGQAPAIPDGVLPTAAEPLPANALADLLLSSSNAPAAVQPSIFDSFKVDTSRASATNQPK